MDLRVWGGCPTPPTACCTHTAYPHAFLVVQGGVPVWLVPVTNKRLAGESDAAARQRIAQDKLEVTAHKFSYCNKEGLHAAKLSAAGVTHPERISP